MSAVLGPAKYCQASGGGPRLKAGTNLPGKIWISYGLNKQHACVTENILNVSSSTEELVPSVVCADSSSKS